MFLAGLLAGLATTARPQKSWLGVLGIAGIAAVACCLWLGYIVRVIWMSNGLHPTAAGLTVVGVSFWAAWTLWQLRRKQRIGYGAAEVLFGLGAAGVLAQHRPGDILTTGISIAAAVYVVVRGLDNIENGLLQPEQTPLRDATSKWSWRRLGQAAASRLRNGSGRSQ